MKYSSNELFGGGHEDRLTEQAYALEGRKAEIKRELEELMRSYAAITGKKEIKRRTQKLGEAPNDWKN